MSEMEFAEFVAAICRRPLMYTPTGSFDEVVSFLESFGAGANVGQHLHHSFSTPFLKWIARKFDFPEAATNFPINGDDFQAMFSSEAEALENLPILYQDYAGRLSPENHPAQT